MIIYANDELLDEFFVIIKMIIKTHFINNLKINIFIKNDVLIS